MSTSIGAWERSAARWPSLSSSARSCARASAATWPMTIAATCTAQIAFAETSWKSIR
jgi:hypothetical protein